MVPDSFNLYSYKYKYTAKNINIQLCPEPEKMLQNQKKTGFCFMWMWSPVPCCSAVRVARQAASGADTVTRLSRQKHMGGVAPKINQHFGGWVKPLEIPLESTQRSQQLGRVWFHGKDGSAAGAMTAGWFQFVSPAKAPKPSWGR